MRLEMLGFQAIFDYVAAKADWLAHNLPTEGTAAGTLRAGGHVRKDAVTCRVTDLLADVRGRVEASPYDFALVVNEQGILLGRLRPSVLAQAGNQPIEDMMEPGPSTTRADTTLEAAGKRMHDHNLHYLIISSPEGELYGVLLRDDVDRVLNR